jgi:hypothetical protein
MSDLGNLYFICLFFFLMVKWNAPDNHSPVREAFIVDISRVMSFLTKWSQEVWDFVFFKKAGFFRVIFNPN